MCAESAEHMFLPLMDMYPLSHVVLGCVGPIELGVEVFGLLFGLHEWTYLFCDFVDVVFAEWLFLVKSNGSAIDSVVEVTPFVGPFLFVTFPQAYLSVSSYLVS